MLHQMDVLQKRSAANKTVICHVFDDVYYNLPRNKLRALYILGKSYLGENILIFYNVLEDEIFFFKRLAWCILLEEKIDHIKP